MAIITSPYISGPDILEHPTRTVKEVRLDFSGVADGCIKAGSPINAAGKVANDATAIGILLHDNYSDCGCGHGMVVVAGRIKADVAEQHCGIAISAEAKGGMPAVAFVNAAGVVTGGGGSGGGGGTFIINITEWGESEVTIDTDTQYIEYKRGGVADKTYAEIENAFNSGMVVMVCEGDAYSESGADCVAKGFYNLEAYMTNSILDVNNYFTFSCFYADHEGAGKTSITIRKNGEVEYDDYWGAYAGGGEA